MIETRLPKIFSLLLFAFVLSLFSCASRPKTPLDLSQVTAEPKHYFDVGEYQKAITAYDLAFRKYPTAEGLLVAYIDSLEKIKLVADHAYETKNYSKAEKMYELLLGNFPLFEDFRMSLSFSGQGLSEQIKSCRLNMARLQAARALQADEFSKALDSIKSLLGTYPADPESLADFDQICVEIQKKASLAVANENYAIAGKGFFALWQNMELLEKLVSPPPFSRPALEEGIKICRSKLTKKGLEQYRKGKLAEAIRIWKELLAFDPENVEIQKAVETATEQLKKLKKNDTGCSGL